MFAAAWAAVVGVVLKYATAPVEAAASLQFGNVASSVPVTNTAGGQTIIIDSASYPTTDAVFVGQSIAGSSRAGLHGVTGTRGVPPMDCGVYGQCDSSLAAALLGDASGIPSGTGVIGRSFTGTGVMGQSTVGVPILGQVAANSSINTIAIYGQNYSTYAGASPGAGGFGVYGISAKGHGLVGATATTGGAAVVGATNGVAGAYAGAFYGPVTIGGALTVVGGPKSAAVPHPDGSHRRLYCMESPESWFEDFGSGRLECGRAEVAIDPDFAAVVNLDHYHVFLTQYDQHNDLCVTDRTPAGFRVQAPNVVADGEFSWRIVARRKDIRGERLETVTIPPEPSLPPSIADLPAQTPREARQTENQIGGRSE
jgi:hypothetical protein